MKIIQRLIRDALQMFLLNYSFRRLVTVIKKKISPGLLNTKHFKKGRDTTRKWNVLLIVCEIIMDRQSE